MYGEGQSKTSLMYLLDRAIQTKEKEFNMSGGDQLRDFLPIDKVIQNIDLIANQDILINQSINCCSGKPISVKNLVQNHLKKRQYQIKLNLGFYPYPSYEPMKFWGDNSKLKTLENK